MQIFFDWELDETIEQPIHKWVYEDLRTFLKSRYRPLEEEIDNRREGEVAFVVVVWNYNATIGIKCFFIPKELCDKLNNALTQDDLDYIINVIGQKIDNKSKEN